MVSNSSNLIEASANSKVAVGLDTVAFIESHYVAERGLSPEKTVDYLQRDFLASQRLGNKSPNGGLYPPTAKSETTDSSEPEARILALDIGLSSAKQSSNAGEILELTPEGQLKPLVKDQAMPDGLAVDSRLSRMFWTCMGTPGKPDGAIYSADLDGSNIRTVISPGHINTPKQLTLDSAKELIYFCDREGCSVFRCGYDGSHLIKVVDNRIRGSEDNVLDWCVGIALSTSLGKLFWTQKGPSKGGKGRLFSADLPTAIGSAATSVRCLLNDLPEPIDLEFDESSHTLYWTDRGELPHGNALYKVQLNANGDVASSGKEVLARHFHEAIGLKLDSARQRIYVTDLGGSIYCYNIEDKSKETLFTDEKRTFTGVTCL